MLQDGSLIVVTSSQKRFVHLVLPGTFQTGAFLKILASVCGNSRLVHCSFLSVHQPKSHKTQVQIQVMCMINMYVPCILLPILFMFAYRMWKLPIIIIIFCILYFRCSFQMIQMIRKALIQTPKLYVVMTYFSFTSSVASSAYFKVSCTAAYSVIGCGMTGKWSIIVCLCGASPVLQITPNQIGTCRRLVFALRRRTIIQVFLKNVFFI